MIKKDLEVYSDLTKFLLKVYGHINKELFKDELTKNVVITVQSSVGCYGHITIGKVWTTGQEKSYEINLGAEGLRRGIVSTVATLVHEMVHLYCLESNVKDTSRGGRYHNKTFKLLAETKLLKIDFNKSIGWSVTSSTPELEKFILKHKYPDIKLFRGGVLTSPFVAVGGDGDGDGDGDVKIKKPSSTRKYCCPICKMTVRATKNVNILCMDCKKQLIQE